MAYAALPLVLHILDVKLSSTPSQLARKQGRLNIYTEAMKDLKPQYDGTDEVSDFVTRMVECISLESPSQAQRKEGSRQGSSWLAPGGAMTVNEWSDVLLRQPSLYVRLVVTIDLALSMGRFPEDKDFPVVLQSKAMPGNRFLLSRTTISHIQEGDEKNGQRDRSTWGSEVLTEGPQVQNINDFSDPGIGGSKELSGQVQQSVRTSPISIIADMELPMNFGFDIGSSDEVGALLDNPAIWGNGMFPDGLQF